MRYGGLICLAVAAAALAPAPAIAGERAYAYTFGPDVTAPGDLEAQTWIGDEVPKAGPGTWDLWVGPDAGIVEGLEGGLFVIIFQGAPQGLTSSAPYVDSLRLHVTYALARKGEWPIDVRVRAEYGIPIGGSLSTAWLTLIASRDLGPINIDANVGVGFAFSADVATYALYSAALSYEIFSGVRWGIEVNGTSYLSQSVTHLFIGPSLGITQKRFWVALNIGPGFGGQSPNYHGRVIVGLNL